MSASTTIPERMTADEFIAWAEQRPDKRYELYDGLVIEKTSERLVHGETKVRMAARVFAQVEQLALPCQVFSGETAIRVNDREVYEPDIVVRCGDRLSPDTLYLFDPLVIVEIHSPSNSRVDLEEKFAAYFSILSLRHYLFVNATSRRIVHHARTEFGPFQTTLLTDGPITLDPPGITISDLFPPA